MAPPAKRNKADKPDKAERRFSSAAEISQSLRSQDEQGLLGGAVRHGLSNSRIPCSPWTMLALTGLRNQLTVRYNEPALPPGDERIRLAREWMETSPGVKELFDLWITINQVRIVYFQFCGNLIYPPPFFLLAPNGTLCRGHIPDVLPPQPPFNSLSRPTLRPCDPEDTFSTSVVSKIEHPPPRKSLRIDSGHHETLQCCVEFRGWSGEEGSHGNILLGQQGREVVEYATERERRY